MNYYWPLVSSGEVELMPWLEAFFLYLENRNIQAAEADLIKAFKAAPISPRVNAVVGINYMLEKNFDIITRKPDFLSNHELQEFLSRLVFSCVFVLVTYSKALPNSDPIEIREDIAEFWNNLVQG